MKLQQSWNVAVGLTDRRLVLLSGAVVAFLLCGGLWGWRVPAFNIGAVTLLGVALVESGGLTLGYRRGPLRSCLPG
jgi:hypothetical protein